MNPYATPPKPAADLTAIHGARATCRELLTLLIEEKHGLAKHDVQRIDDNIQNKRRLTLRLEQLLGEIKQTGAVWKNDANGRNQAALLADEIAIFQTMARENAMMLKAAHQLRADLILAIRDTVDAAQPRVQTYGSTGALNMADNATRLVARNI